MKKDLILTFFTEFFVLASGILVYRLAATLLGKEGFSEYALSRRTISLMHPIVLMGVTVGMPRYIAYSLSNSNKSNNYFWGGVFILFVIGLLITILFNIFNDKISFLIFGNTKYKFLLIPINIMLWGVIFHSLCYSYFRGNFLFLKANILQFFNLGIAIPISFIIGKNTKEVILITGIIWIIISIFFFLFFIKNFHLEKDKIISSIKELMIYGIQRVPGDLSLAGLLALPAILTAHISSVKEAGYVAFGISILQMIGAVYAPVGLVLLPKISQILSNNQFQSLKYYFYKILKIILPITIFGIIFFEFFANQIITIYLGESFSELITASRIIVIGGLGYVIYVSMRSIIDAYYVKAINTKNLILSLSLFLIFFMLGKVCIKNYNYISILNFFIVSLYCLGALTTLEIRKILIKCNLK